MKNIIIGTAGHVDHGKTQLIGALTGIDTDRLKEEKQRGITIELGFAHLDLPSGERAGIVDVPGHEKFIRHMLAGAGGMDLVLLVIAADDGVMPQTREHLDILRLLDVREGLIVLTKCDLVDADWIELVSEDIRQTVKGTFLEGASILPVSSLTGMGIDQLKAAIYDKVAGTQAKNTARPFRIPVDRVFTVEGFGTVITGTLIEGTLRVGDEAEIFPTGTRARVRNLQVHGADVDTAYAGQRVAVNLAGISREELERGNTVAQPGSMADSLMLDVRLDILPGCEREIKNGSRLHFHHGTHEVLCKLALLDGDRLAPGASGYAQLRFGEPVAVKQGDHFVVRFYSPLETVGGGTVIDPNPLKHRRGVPAVIEALKRRESGTVGDHIYQVIADMSRDLPTAAAIGKQFELDKESFRAELDTLVAEGRVIPLSGDVVIADTYRQSLSDTLTALLADHHKQNPLQAGLRKDELRSRLLPGHKPAAADRVLDHFAEAGVIRYVGQRVALSNFEVTYDETAAKLRDAIAGSFEAAGFTPPALDGLIAGFPSKERTAAEQVAEALMDSGTLVNTEPGIHFHTDAVETAKGLFKAIAEAEGGKVTLPQFRDRTGTSRKFALSLLEYFDRTGLTRKVDDARIPVRL